MQMPPDLRALMERFIQLGEQLPDKDDPNALATTRKLLDEMRKVQNQINDILAPSEH